MLVREGQVLLVKHTYKPGWYLPGGGVKTGETLETAVRREAREEVGAELGALQLFGMYSGFEEYKSDHIAMVTCDDFHLTGIGDAEIAQVAWFPLDQLPEDITDGTKRRITEYLRGLQPAALRDW